jgi:4-hydroxy-3-polyprenylbenzoate decarboxylase
MLWNDLREYLNRLEECGELKRINGAHWSEEIGAIAELMTERRGPALLFDEIKDYPSGYRVAANVFSTPRRTAIAFGMPPDPADTLAQRWAQMMEKFHPVTPKEISRAPVFENVVKGEEIDLFKFPTPKWHEKDVGRYIGTGVCVIQRDPDTGFVNVGAYRIAVHDKNTCTIFIEHGKHGDRIRRKFWAHGKKCPVVVSVGQDPVLTALSGSAIYHCPEGVSEYEAAGFVHGSPYPVVPAPVTGIPMPANAEIVIEGFIPSPDEAMEMEGPFGEWTGYYAHGRRPETIIEVAAVYYRNDPIIFGAPPVRPINCVYFANLGGEDTASKAKLEKAGIPGVAKVFLLARPFLKVVSIKQMYERHVDDVIRLLVPGGDQYRGHEIWVLVDDDIDPTNSAEVLWAIASRCAPEVGVKVIPGTGVWQLDPRIPPEDRSSPDQDHGRRRYMAHNLVINACRPFAWLNDFPPVAVNSAELRKRTMESWKHLWQ